MGMTSIGNLAQHYMLQRQNTSIRNQMMSLTQELASGLKTEPGHTTTGGHTPLSELDHSLKVLAGFNTSISEARVKTAISQSTLETIQNKSSDISSTLITASSDTSSTIGPTVSKLAIEEFKSIVSLLNTRIGDSSLFAGAAVDQPALAAPDEILNSLKTSLAGAVNVQDFKDRLDQWFSSTTSGFSVEAYQGSEHAASDYQLGESDAVSFAFRADSSEARDVLHDLALAGFASDSEFNFSATDRQHLLRSAGENLLARQADLTSIRADLGYVQERIDEASVSNAAATSSLKIAQSEIVSADPFETAVKLENTQTQLKSLYTVTGRMSQLSLAGYLR